MAAIWSQASMNEATPHNTYRLPLHPADRSSAAPGECVGAGNGMTDVGL
jgi:hypothetical protein